MSLSLIARRCVAVAARRGAVVCRAFSDGGSVSYGSDSVSYSGGQPGGVQGGFYGAGGARSAVDPKAHQRPEAVAALDDVRRLREIMQDVTDMETELERINSPVAPRTIELKSTIKKRLSSPSMITLLNRLEIKEQPVWGLSQEERELVKLARAKVNSC